MSEWLSRVERMVGNENLQKLCCARIAVLGLGGVGAFAAESLCRSGIGSMLLVDSDCIDISNLNRQLIALRDTVGEPKIQIAQARFKNINPDIDITGSNEFLLSENIDFIREWQPDVVLDAIDTVTAKLAVAKLCSEANIPLISCMGTGNRLHPELLRIGRISDTAGCGCSLARVMRRELTKREIPSPIVVYSTELPLEPVINTTLNGRHPPASMAFVPCAAGSTMAATAVRLILGL